MEVLKSPRRVEVSSGRKKKLERIEHVIEPAIIRRSKLPTGQQVDLPAMRNAPLNLYSLFIKIAVAHSCFRKIRHFLLPL